MSIIHGPRREPPPPPKDFSYEQAVEDTRRDYARLLYEHDLFWHIDDTGKVTIGCCCSEIEFAVTAQQREHIQGAVRKVRGPIKK